MNDSGAITQAQLAALPDGHPIIVRFGDCETDVDCRLRWVRSVPFAELTGGPLTPIKDVAIDQVWLTDFCPNCDDGPQLADFVGCCSEQCMNERDACREDL